MACRVEADLSNKFRGAAGSTRFRFALARGIFSILGSRGGARREAAFFTVGDVTCFFHFTENVAEFGALRSWKGELAGDFAFVEGTSLLAADEGEDALLKRVIAWGFAGHAGVCSIFHGLTTADLRQRKGIFPLVGSENRVIV